MIDPVAFEILGRPIYWYGIFVAVGFLAGVLHWNLLARRVGFPAGIGSDLGFLVMIGGIVGARVAYVIANWAHYAAHPVEVLRIDQGGLIYYGGFLLAALCVVMMARARGLPLWRLGDFTISALPLGHALGRIGCFLNGCCYGAPSDAACALFNAGTRRLPVQLFEAGFNLLLYGAFLWMLRRGGRPGRLVVAYLAGYGLWRFLIENLRGDERAAAFAGLDVAQALSLGLVAAAAILWPLLRRFGPPDSRAV